MSEKRRDSRGRILQSGESQRLDGRYVYVYVDNNHKQKFVYSWKLEKNDPIPKGKRNCVSLREKKKEIWKNQDKGIIPDGGEITVLELVRRYVSQKKGVRHNTKAN